MVNPAEMGGRRHGEKPSSFSVTCSLLSQYLKEKGSFGDLGLGITAAAARLPVDVRGKPETLRTMNLLPGVDAAGGEDDSAANKGAGSDQKRSMDLFPNRAGFGPLHPDSKPDLNREPRVGSAQMTMFYGGKVVVFDNFPADKARELMAMARRGCPESAPVMVPQRPSCPQPAHHNPAAAAILASISDPNKPPAAAAAPAVATPAVVVQEAQQKPPQPAASDLPIARRVSLNRFLEKRKDRRSSRAPYPVNGSLAEASAANLEKQQWLGLAPQVSKPADLHG
uniref:Protein TIFY n=1 Tax=Anthurium amnicola TaxID=1678845 RepID=A0A1D1ZGM9_9ARAE